MTGRWRRVLAGVAGAALAGLASPAAATCADLVGDHPGDVRVTAATEIVPAPEWAAPTQPAYNGRARTPFCRVEGVIEGDIRFEVWLPPRAAWGGRLLGAGVGGNAGMLNYADMARAVSLGFAATSTDSGHSYRDLRWMMDRRKQENYAHRAEHLMTVAAKRIVAAYYGQAAHRAYFLGCSGGGRQALKEAQLYPQDYDGIVAGAPGPDMPMLSGRHLRVALMQQADPAGALTDADWDLAVASATAQCDAADGVKDGVIEDPRACRFDAGKVGLPPAKAAMLQAIMAPIRDETGRPIDQGLFPGVRTRPGPPPPLLLELFAQGVHGDPDWDPKTFSIVRDVAAVYEKMPQLRADDPDLSRLKARGAKLILYNGWSDPSVIAQQVLSYYDSVRARMGPEATDAFVRLYMAPGVLHCRGGSGPDLFGGSGAPPPVPDPQHDLLLAIVDWVERGRAPDRIIASKVEGGRVVRTRPLCPYPQVARHDGKGDPNDAASFTCR